MKNIHLPNLTLNLWISYPLVTCNSFKQNYWEHFSQWDKIYFEWEFSSSYFIHYFLSCYRLYIVPTLNFLYPIWTKCYFENYFSSFCTYKVYLQICRVKMALFNWQKRLERRWDADNIFWLFQCKKVRIFVLFLCVFISRFLTARNYSSGPRY